MSMKKSKINSNNNSTNKSDSETSFHTDSSIRKTEPEHVSNYVSGDAASSSSSHQFHRGKNS